MYRRMLNNGGSGSGIRKVLGSMVHYVLLYAATMWQKALVYNEIRKYQESRTCTKKSTPRVCSTYRNVSTEAALVISGTLPIQIKVYRRVLKRSEGRCGGRRPLCQAVISGRVIYLRIQHADNSPITFNINAKRWNQGEETKEGGFIVEPSNSPILYGPDGKSERICSSPQKKLKRFFW